MAAHTMGEFGVVLMVGGNISGVTRTVSIDISLSKVQGVVIPEPMPRPWCCWSFHS